MRCWLRKFRTRCRLRRRGKETVLLSLHTLTGVDSLKHQPFSTAQFRPFVRRSLMSNNVLFENLTALRLWWRISRCTARNISKTKSCLDFVAESKSLRVPGNPFLKSLGSSFPLTQNGLALHGVQSEWSSSYVKSILVSEVCSWQQWNFLAQ